MKLSRKNVGRIATTFLATAMLASLTAVPAMAVDSVPISPVTPAQQIQTGENDAALTFIGINKLLNKPENAYAPNVEFTFSVAKADSDLADGALLENETATGIMNGENIEIEVYNGVTGGVYVDTADQAVNNGVASFAPSVSDIGNTTIASQAKFAIDNTKFTHAGVYKYILTEQANPTDDINYEGITNDTASTRDLYVYVRENDEGKYEVYGAVVKGTDDDKTDHFTNTYLGGGTDPDNNELIISKEVAGEMGNKTNQFEFNIYISGGEGEWYKAVYQKTTDGQSWVTDPSKDVEGVVVDGVFTITANTNYTFKLAHNERIYIYGLSDSDNYNITEIRANQDNYVTNVDGCVKEEDNLISNDEVSNQVNGSVNPDADQIKDIHFVNTREAVSPTGIVTNVAPYALLVVIAAAGCFVFLRKRDED